MKQEKFCAAAAFDALTDEIEKSNGYYAKVEMTGNSYTLRVFRSGKFQLVLETTVPKSVTEWQFTRLRQLALAVTETEEDATEVWEAQQACDMQQEEGGEA